MHEPLYLASLLTVSSTLSVYNASRSLTNKLLGTPPPTDMSAPYLITRIGYPSETHKLTTPSGYILTLHRIPSKIPSKYPVLVQHGNFQSSSDWLINTPKHDSLAFHLSDAGYDVWLANQRGNEYSTAHTHLPVSSPAFWNFSFHEMGTEDLPSTISYVLSHTHQKKLHFIGFSLGTTQFFAGLSHLPSYNSRIGVSIHLGPSTFQNNFFNAWVKLVAPFVWILELLSSYLGHMPVLPQFVANLLHKVLPVICHPKIDVFGVCVSAVQLAAGHDQGLISKARLHEVTKISPSSSSFKAFLHELQLMGTGRFCEYDYGETANILAYGTPHPPDYNLTNVHSPVALVVGPNDLLAHRDDAKTLAKRLPNLVDFYYVPYEHFTHLDFCYANNVSSLVYNHVVRLLNQFDNT